MTLSKKHQLFLMGLLMGRNTRKTQGVYGSLAFYRAITYLKRNNLIKARRLDDRIENGYYLTIKGNILARTLAGLTSSPEEFRGKSIT